MPKFMILMQENDRAWSALAQEEQSRLMNLYFAWVDQLRKMEVLRDGAPLEAGGQQLRLVDGEVIDGPYTETKEVLTGYFVIEVGTIAEAVRLAQGCPALTHGETVLVRQLGTT
jgi:hypothetical protein